MAWKLQVAALDAKVRLMGYEDGGICPRIDEAIQGKGVIAGGKKWWQGV